MYVYLMVFVTYHQLTEVDLGEGCRECTPPPPPPKMKPSSLYSILKFVYFTNQLRHSSVLHPLLRKMLDLPLTEVHLDELCVKRMSYSIKYNMHYFGNLFCR